MDFGLFVPCHRFDASLSVKELYDQVLEMVKLADEAGFNTVWFPEHHLVQYYASPSPLMWMVKAAAATRRVRVGAAILVLSLDVLSLVSVTVMVGASVVGMPCGNPA